MGWLPLAVAAAFSAGTPTKSEGPSDTDTGKFSPWRVTVSPISSFTVPNWTGRGVNTRVPRTGFGGAATISMMAFDRVSVSLSAEYDQSWWNDVEGKEDPWVHQASVTLGPAYVLHDEGVRRLRAGLGITAAKTNVWGEWEKPWVYLRPFVGYERMLSEKMLLDLALFPIVAFPPALDFHSHPGWDVWLSPGMSVGIGWSSAR